MILSKSLSYYMIGYTIVTIVSSLHFLFNWKVIGQEGFDTSKGIQALKTNATLYRLSAMDYISLCSNIY